MPSSLGLADSGGKSHSSSLHGSNSSNSISAQLPDASGDTGHVQNALDNHFGSSTTVISAANDTSVGSGSARSSGGTFLNDSRDLARYPWLSRSGPPWHIKQFLMWTTQGATPEQLEVLKKFAARELRDDEWEGWRRNRKGNDVQVTWDEVMYFMIHQAGKSHQMNTLDTIIRALDREILMQDIMPRLNECDRKMVCEVLASNKKATCLQDHGNLKADESFGVSRLASNEQFGEGSGKIGSGSGGSGFGEVMDGDGNNGTRDSRELLSSDASGLRRELEGEKVQRRKLQVHLEQLQQQLDSQGSLLKQQQRYQAALGDFREYSEKHHSDTIQKLLTHNRMLTDALDQIQRQGSMQSQAAGLASAALSNQVKDRRKFEETAAKEALSFCKKK
jgi:hypothetical protein